jgi:monoamine oxidase
MRQLTFVEPGKVRWDDVPEPRLALLLQQLPAGSSLRIALVYDEPFWRAETARFGPRAAQPRDYHEQDWAAEEWTRGCFMAHYPPGVLTQLGHVLRTPVGRIHWAGTETSPVMNGFIDGAVRSGERAAEEVVVHLGSVAARATRGASRG